MTDTAPHADQQLRDRIAEAIWERQNPGRSFADCKPRWRADAVADADAALAAVEAELDRYRAERDQFADRVDTLTAVCKGNKRHVQEMYLDLQKAQAETEQLRAENARLASIPNGDDLPLLCPDCPCADCGGGFGHHFHRQPCRCGCNPACDRFIRDPQLDQIATAIEPMLGSPLAEGVAHAAWHAIHPSA